MAASCLWLKRLALEPGEGNELLYHPLLSPVTNSYRRWATADLPLYYYYFIIIIVYVCVYVRAP